MEILSKEVGIILESYSENMQLQNEDSIDSDRGPSKMLNKDLKLVVVATDVTAVNFTCEPLQFAASFLGALNSDQEPFQRDTKGCRPHG